jgi:hypothetical protein
LRQAGEVVAKFFVCEDIIKVFLSYGILCCDFVTWPTFRDDFDDDGGDGRQVLQHSYPDIVCKQLQADKHQMLIRLKHPLDP